MAPQICRCRDHSGTTAAQEPLRQRRCVGLVNSCSRRALRAPKRATARLGRPMPRPGLAHRFRGADAAPGRGRLGRWRARSSSTASSPAQAASLWLWIAAPPGAPSRLSPRQPCYPVLPCCSYSAPARTARCGPCKLFKPTFEQFAEAYHEQAVFVSVMGDANTSTAKLMKRLAVKSVPAFFFFREGQQVGDWPTAPALARDTRLQHCTFCPLTFPALTRLALRRFPSSRAQTRTAFATTWRSSSRYELRAARCLTCTHVALRDTSDLSAQPHTRAETATRKDPRNSLYIW